MIWKLSLQSWKSNNKGDPSITLSNPNDITNSFLTFYSKVYSSEVILDKDKYNSLLENLNLPYLSQEDSELLQVPIPLEELTFTVVSMNKGKSPGWDGIPPEFCLVFWDHLGSLMLQIILHSIDRGFFDWHPFFDRDTNPAILMVLPKPNYT